MLKRIANRKIRNTDSTLLDLVKLFIKEVQDDELTGIAKSMAFSFTLAIFPGIIFLFTLIPYIPIADLNTYILSYLQSVLPETIYQFTADSITDIISLQRGSLLSLGFVIAMYSSTSGVLSMMDGFNQCYRTNIKRGFFKTQLLALFINILLTFCLISSILVLVVSKIALNYFMALHFVAVNTYNFIVLMQLGSVFLFFYLSISAIYYFGPTVKKTWGFFSVGALFASVLALLATFLMSIYFENFASYNKVYGSIGTIMALMFWLYIVSFVILLGFELNVSYLKIVSNIKDDSDHLRAKNIE
ncbi:MAG: YihY/virulence factor BrkB family protein [Cytophagales bacterium]